MLLRTHGKKGCSLTKLGKEIFVFLERIENQITLLNNIPFSIPKFGGATGNFNAIMYRIQNLIGLNLEIILLMTD